MGERVDGGATSDVGANLYYRGWKMERSKEHKKTRRFESERDRRESNITVLFSYPGLVKLNWSATGN